jgi:hypothetical protein
MSTIVNTRWRDRVNYLAERLEVYEEWRLKTKCGQMEYFGLSLHSSYTPNLSARYGDWKQNVDKWNI